MIPGSTVSPTASLRWRTAVFTLSALRPLLIFRRPLEMTRAFSPTRHGIPLLAIAMVSFAGWSIAAKHDPRVTAPPPIAAPTNPYDDRDYRAAVAQGEAAVAAAEASIAAIDQSLILQRDAIDQARAALDNAEAE